MVTAASDGRTGSAPYGQHYPGDGTIRALGIGDRCVIHVSADLAVTFDPETVVTRIGPDSLQLSAPWLPNDCHLILSPNSRIVGRDGRDGPNLYDAVSAAFPR